MTRLLLVMYTGDGELLPVYCRRDLLGHHCTGLAALAPGCPDDVLAEARLRLVASFTERYGTTPHAAVESGEDTMTGNLDRLAALPVLAALDELAGGAK